MRLWTYSKSKADMQIFFTALKMIKANWKKVGICNAKIQMNYVNNTPRLSTRIKEVFVCLGGEE